MIAGNFFFFVYSWLIGKKMLLQPWVSFIPHDSLIVIDSYSFNVSPPFLGFDDSCQELLVTSKIVSMLVVSISSAKQKLIIDMKTITSVFPMMFYSCLLPHRCWIAISSIITQVAGINFLFYFFQIVSSIQNTNSQDRDRPRILSQRRSKYKEKKKL